MKTNLALAALCLAAAGCSSTPQWDEAVFPNQVVYDTQSTATAAKAPAK